MKVKDFYDWISRIPQLTKRQRIACLRRFDPDVDTPEKPNMPSVISEAEAKNCPHCGCHILHRHGHASGLQRWKCMGCSKTFNILTGTSLARLRIKEKWIANAKAMMTGLTVRDTATEVGVSPTTSFRWRHRFLKSHKQAQQSNLQGIAECDATCFYHSEKGTRNLNNRNPRKRGGDKIGPGKTKDLVHVLTLRDRSGKGADRVAPTGQTALAVALFQTHLRSDTLLITDGCTELCAAAKIRDPDAHLSLPGLESRGLKGSPFNIQRINAFHSDLKGWMARFNGVATKYLANYIGWHRHRVEETHRNDPETFILLSFNPLAVNPQLTLT